MYLSAQRRDYILRLLAERGSVRSAQLARELGVTDETIRTDLIALEKLGQLKRSHGGATYCIPTHAEKSPASRLLLPLIPLLKREKLIYLEDSTLSRLLLKLLEDTPLQLLSNAPALLETLQAPAHPHHVMSTGGVLHKESKLLLGELAEKNLRSMPMTCCILAPEHLTPTHAGYVKLHYPTHEQARWVEQVHARCARCFIIGRRAMIEPYQEITSSAVTQPLHTTTMFSEGAAPPSNWSPRTIPQALFNRLQLTQLVEAPDHGEEAY